MFCFLWPTILSINEHSLNSYILSWTITSHIVCVSVCAPLCVHKCMPVCVRGVCVYVRVCVMVHVAPQDGGYTYQTSNGQIYKLNTPMTSIITRLNFWGLNYALKATVILGGNIIKCNFYFITSSHNVEQTCNRKNKNQTSKTKITQKWPTNTFIKIRKRLLR